MGRHDERRLLVFSMVSASMAHPETDWFVLDILQLANIASHSESRI